MQILSQQYSYHSLHLAFTEFLLRQFLRVSITMAGNSALVHSTEGIQVVDWGFFDIYIQVGAT